ncbi:MAG: hypothetical protein H6610_08100 [Ignavibacteriales bacterium]|nr:hypothetical protein [Ignavibacteriales bacterium]
MQILRYDFNNDGIFDQTIILPESTFSLDPNLFEIIIKAIYMQMII